MNEIAAPGAFVSAELRAIAARRNVTHAAIAEQLGRTKMWLSRRMNALTPLTVDDLVLLSASLDVDPVTVLADAITAAAPVAPAPTP